MEDIILGQGIRHQLNVITFNPALKWRVFAQTPWVALCQHNSAHQTRLLIVIADFNDSYSFAIATVQEHKDISVENDFRVSGAPTIVTCDNNQDREDELNQVMAQMDDYAKMVAEAPAGSPMRACPRPSKVALLN